MFLSKLFKSKASKLITLLGAFAMFFGTGATVIASDFSQSNETVETKAADYSSTIRVYVDLNWDNIDYVRVGTKEASGNAVLATSNIKYRRDQGKYVFDVSSGSTYDRMGIYFSQSGEWWQYQYDDGCIWIDDSKFQPGYEFKIDGIGYVSASDGKKYFKAKATSLGTIADCVSNPTFYFVDGYSWHIEKSVKAYWWGGTASCSDYPGNDMTLTDLRLKCYVGETEFEGIYVYSCTLSGTAVGVKFSDGVDKGEATGDLVIENGKTYYFGVDAGAYDRVLSFIETLAGKRGSHTYKGRSFPSSICKISKSDAETIILDYNTITTSGSDKEKSSLPGCALVTYDSPETGTGTGQVTIEDIIEQLQKKVDGAYGAGVIPGAPTGQESPLTTTLWIVLASGIAGLAAIGSAYFISKKKKRNRA